MSIKHAGVSVAGFAVAAALVACGGGGEQGRPIVAEDLPQVVLQREDVKIGVMREIPLSPESASAAYATEFKVPAEDVEPGAIVCIESQASLYDTVEDATVAFDESLIRFGEIEDEVEAVQAMGDEAEQFSVSRLVTRPLGSECPV